MRIAVWHNLPSGGGKRALYDHIRGLVARGHHVEAWSPSTADRAYLPLGNLVPEHVVELEWPIRPRRTDDWQITLQTERALGAMDVHCARCAEQILRGRFDVLFANSCQFFRATSIGRFVPLPSVLYQQEPYRWLYEALPRLRWLAPPTQPRSRLSRGALKAVFKDWRSIRNWRLQAREEVDNAAAFTRILVNSRFSRESILRAYGLDADVCYLGIDVERFTDLDLAREDFIIGLGSFTPEKNLGLVIEGVGRVPPPRPKLVWIGNMAIQSYLADMVELAKARHVDFVPLQGIADETLIEWLNRAFAMVYAPRLEPFGLAPLEAGACGVPVIAVAEGGVRETIEDGVTGLLVEHDPDAVASAITRLRDEPRLARTLGSNGRSAVEAKWSWQAATDRIERKLQHYAATRKEKA